MKTKYAVNFLIVVFFIVMGVASTFVRAEGLCYSTGFERPTFMPGQLDLQDGWRNPQKTALILPAHPLSGKQSIRVFGNKLNKVGEQFGTRFGRLFFYDATDKTVDVSVDAKLDGPSTDTGLGESDDLISANLDLLLADDMMRPVFIGALLLSSSGDVWVYDSDGQHLNNVPVDLGEHHRLGARIDFSERKVYFSVNGDYVTTLPIKEAITTNILAIAALSMFTASEDRISERFFNRNLYNAYYDDYCVATTDCEIQCLPE